MTLEELDDQLESLVDKAFEGSLSKQNILEALQTTKERVESGVFDEKE